MVSVFQVAAALGRLPPHEEIGDYRGDWSSSKWVREWELRGSEGNPYLPSDLQLGSESALDMR